MLESAFVENGDEHAVFVLLVADWERSKTTFTNESRSGSQLSGACHVHRNATIRYAPPANNLKRLVVETQKGLQSQYTAAPPRISGCMSPPLKLSG